MDPSIVILLCLFTLSTVSSVGLSAWMWYRARRSSQEAEKLSSSAVDAIRMLEQAVAQRSSIADEVSALRAPLEMAAARSAVLIEATQKATTELAGNLASVPKMVEALAEIAKREIELLEQIKGTAQTLYSALHGKGPQRGYKPTDPMVADHEYEIQKYMQEEGLGRSEAEDQVQHDRTLPGFRVTR